VTARNLGDRIWGGESVIYFAITRYDGTVVTYYMGKRGFSWFKDGGKGQLTPTANPPETDDLRIEWQQ
jgi:hypothetical protein